MFCGPEALSPKKLQGQPCLGRSHLLEVRGEQTPGKNGQAMFMRLFSFSPPSVDDILFKALQVPAKHPCLSPPCSLQRTVERFPLGALD